MLDRNLALAPGANRFIASVAHVPTDFVPALDIDVCDQSLCTFMAGFLPCIDAAAGLRRPGLHALIYEFSNFTGPVQAGLIDRVRYTIELTRNPIVPLLAAGLVAVPRHRRRA